MFLNAMSFLGKLSGEEYLKRIFNCIAHIILSNQDNQCPPAPPFSLFPVTGAVFFGGITQKVRGGDHILEVPLCNSIIY